MFLSMTCRLSGHFQNFTLSVFFLYQYTACFSNHLKKYLQIKVMINSIISSPFHNCDWIDVLFCFSLILYISCQHFFNEITKKPIIHKYFNLYVLKHTVRFVNKYMYESVKFNVINCTLKQSRIKYLFYSIVHFISFVHNSA